MKKKLCSLSLMFILILGFPLVVSAGGSDDDGITPVYNVKCEYNLVAAHPADEGTSLTTLWVYVDETNRKYKSTYLDKSSKEKEFTGNHTDYKNYDNTTTEYYLKDWNGKGKDEPFDYSYRNNNNTCPDMYVYIEPWHSYFTFPAYNQEYAKNPYKKISANKKYTSTDGGKTWSSGGGNTSPDDIQSIMTCSYGFLTDIGSATSDPFIVQIKFQKMKNHTKNTFIYDVYITGDNYERSYKNVLGQDEPMSIYPLGRDSTGLYDYAQLSILPETVKTVLDGARCLDDSSIWLYDNGDMTGAKEFVITHDYNKALENALDGIYDGYSGTKFLNAEKDYKAAGQALIEAMEKFKDNDWANKSDEACDALFGGIDNGTNALINNYESAKATLKSVWPGYDCSAGDEVLNRFKTYKCDLSVSIGDKVYGCEVIPSDIREWIKDTLNLVKYIALVLVIVLGILDFIKAAASGEADQMKKSGSSFLKRIIAVIILFLLPVIVELVLNLIEIYGADSTCLPE